MFSFRLWVLLYEDGMNRAACMVNLGPWDWGQKPLPWDDREENGNPSPSQCCQAVKLKDHGNAQPLEILLCEIISPLIWKPPWAVTPVTLSQKHLHWYTGNTGHVCNKDSTEENGEEETGEEGPELFKATCTFSLPFPTPGHLSGQISSCWWGNTGHLLFADTLIPRHTPGLLRSGGGLGWLLFIDE